MSFFKKEKKEWNPETTLAEEKTTQKVEEPKKEQLNLKKPLSEIEQKTQDKKIIEILKTIKDPELDIDIWSLELIYDIDAKDKDLDIKMTFTSPMCPFGPELVASVKKELIDIGYNEPNIEIVFSPPWEPYEETREVLGLT